MDRRTERIKCWVPRQRERRLRHPRCRRRLVRLARRAGPPKGHEHGWDHPQQTCPGEESLEKRPPVWFRGCPNKEPWRHDEPHELGVRHSWEEGDPVVRRLVETTDAVKWWLPILTTKMQVWTAAVPPKRVPLRHSVPVHPGGGQGLAASHHHQVDLIRNTGTSKRTKYPRPSSSRGLHDLLVSSDPLARCTLSLASLKASLGRPWRAGERVMGCQEAEVGGWPLCVWALIRLSGNVPLGVGPGGGVTSGPLNQGRQPPALALLRPPGLPAPLPCPARAWCLSRGRGQQ